MELNEKNVIATVNGIEVPKPPTPKKKKKTVNRYLINILVVLVIAGFVLYFSLKDEFDLVIASIQAANPYWLIVVFAFAIAIVLIDAVVLFILARLYTTHYSIPKGIANSIIGTFYNDVTPSSSGGQFVQAYVFKKQGIDLASAASIMVMHFLLYQIILVIYGIAALVIKLPLLLSLNPAADINIFGFIKFKLTLIPLSLIGFIFNFSVIATILLLSYWKWLHNVAINAGVRIGTKLKLIKHPDTTKQNWQSQIENFRIELRRLQSNIPVTILILVLFIIQMTMFYSLPYIIGLALRVSMTQSYFDTVFMASYLQMMTNLSPTLGEAGFSEYFFTQVFYKIYGSGALTTAAQLIWRTATFYLGLIVGGIVTAFYRAAPKEKNFKTDRKTFLELQRSTYEMRKKTSDTMFQTSQLSRKDIEKEIKKTKKDLFGNKRLKGQKKIKSDHPESGLAEPNDEDKPLD